MWEGRLRGFGPIGLLAIVAILLGNFLFVPLSAILVVALGSRLANAVARSRLRAPRELGHHGRFWRRVRHAAQTGDEEHRHAAARRRASQPGIPVSSRQHRCAARHPVPGDRRRGLRRGDAVPQLRVRAAATAGGNQRSGHHPHRGVDVRLVRRRALSLSGCSGCAAGDDRRGDLRHDLRGHPDESRC